MSFRQFGGLNYAPKHNIVASNYNTTNELFLTGTDITGPTGYTGPTGPTDISSSNNNWYGTNTFNNSVSFSDSGTITIGGYGGGGGLVSSYIYFPTTFPTTGGSNNGLSFFWDQSIGGGEVSMICYAQGAGGNNPAGGLKIWTCNGSSNLPQQVASFLYDSSSISTNPQIPTSTNVGSLSLSNTATTYWVNSLYAPLASPHLTGVPIAVTNTSPTNSSTQIATNAFVQSVITNTFQSKNEDFSSGITGLNVTFSPSFSSTPTVVITQNWGSSTPPSPLPVFGVQNVTNTSFTIFTDSSLSSPCTINWIAIYQP
jgi:hypothetical protein